ncbi:hypothetical protein [Priestia endophytica]|uniref:hypothetical protein n=1 Tax=Priestia endophytica TaxID=135735 RepID=UPI00227E7F03|nr:hypothetical protein [Priestia endophytica]MCY8233887.1 hypothetical protein [Priestia endophytica]
MKTNFETFANNYVFVGNKTSVRSLANDIKHKNSLKVKELYKPYEFNVRDKNGVEVNLRQGNIGLSYDHKFFDINNPSDELGDMHIEYSDDLYIDIEYQQGELFRAKDYVKSDSLYGLDDIYNELILYRDNIITLYNDLYNIIDPGLDFNPILENTKFKTSTPVNLDEFFKDV